MVQDLPALSYLQNKGLLQMSNWTWHGMAGWDVQDPKHPNLALGASIFLVLQAPGQSRYIGSSG